jgi:hypothetical protein
MLASPAHRPKYMRFVAALVHALSKVSFRLLKVIRSNDPELVEKIGEPGKAISMPRSNKSSMLFSAFV